MPLVRTPGHILGPHHLRQRRILDAEHREGAAESLTSEDRLGHRARLVSLPARCVLPLVDPVEGGELGHPASGQIQLGKQSLQGLQGVALEVPEGPVEVEEQQGAVGHQMRAVLANKVRIALHKT